MAEMPRLSLTPDEPARPGHHQLFRHSSPDSLNDEDPLSAAESTGPPRITTTTTTTTTPQGSRIAVVLKASPSPAHASTLLTKNKNEFRVDLFSQVKQAARPAQTPVPLPVPVQLGPSASGAPAIKSDLGGGRGRPKGWKPGMSYAAMRGSDMPTSSAARPTTAAAAKSARQVKPKPPPSGYAKRRGRPPKAPSPSPQQVYRGLTTPFVAFVCEWQGCKAELHNLETLRRHVYAVHSYGGPTVCQWGKCAAKSSHDALPDGQAFRAHVEETHLVPLSWHLGDGPQNTGAHHHHHHHKAAAAGGGDEIPDYLKDAEGNQVTLSIRDQDVEDFATWRNNRRRLKDLLVRMNDNLPSEESDTAEDHE